MHILTITSDITLAITNPYNRTTLEYNNVTLYPSFNLSF